MTKIKLIKKIKIKMSKQPNKNKVMMEIWFMQKKKIQDQ